MPRWCGLEAGLAWNSAEAKARRDLTINEIFRDLAASQNSPYHGVAALLLQRVELHRFDVKFRWNTRVQSFVPPLPAPSILPSDVTGRGDMEEMEEELEVTIPEHRTIALLKDVRDDNRDPSELSFPHSVYWVEGEFELHPPGLRAVVDSAGFGERKVWEVRFANCIVCKPAFERRLSEVGVEIPHRWKCGDQPVPQSTNKRKYDSGLQEFVTEILGRLERPTRSQFTRYLGENASSDAPLEGVPGCDDVYLDGECMVWIDRSGTQRSITFRSLEPYIRRAKG